MRLQINFFFLFPYTSTDGIITYNVQINLFRAALMKTSRSLCLDYITVSSNNDHLMNSLVKTKP